MGKLKLQPDPTFKSKVGIPVVGDVDALVEFTFKFRTKDELQAFIAISADRPDTETILEMATAWDLTDPFNAASIDLLVQTHIGAPRSIFDKYVDEHTKVRAKN
jgi:hypothetical protein